MPSTPHEAPLELLRQNPMLAAILLRQAGVRIRRKVTARDLTDPDVQDLVVAKITQPDAERAKLYASFILNIAPDSARRALEVKMAAADFPIHPVAERFGNSLARIRDQAWAGGVAEGKAEGRAAGETEMLLMIAAKRGIDVDAATRARVLACTDDTVIATWADCVLTGSTATEIFAS